MLNFFPFLAAIFLSIVTVVADIFVKKASLEVSIWNKWLIFGVIIYGLTAFGWVYVMRNIKLSVAGIIYGVSCIILLVLVSVFIFNEKINYFEIIGIIMGICSILILYKFS